MEYFLLIGFLVLLVLCVVQLTVKLKIFYNLNNNSGRVVVKMAFLKVVDKKIKFCHGCLRLTDKKNKNTYIPLEFNKQTIEQYSNFQDILFRKTYFKNISVFCNFGLKHNSFGTAMFCGCFDVLTKLLYSVFKTKKEETEFVSKIYPNFNSSVIKIGFKVKISLSVYDLFWSFLESKLPSNIKKEGRKQNAKQNRKFDGTGLDKNKASN